MVSERELKMPFKIVTICLVLLAITACEKSTVSKSEQELSIAKHNFTSMFVNRITGTNTLRSIRNWTCTGPIISNKQGKRVAKCTYMLKGGYVNENILFCPVEKDVLCDPSL